MHQLMQITTLTSLHHVHIDKKILKNLLVLVEILTKTYKQTQICMHSITDVYISKDEALLE